VDSQAPREGDLKILLPENVLEAARARIAWLFDEFETVAVAVSGGKDSTVVFHLTLEEARRRGRLPLPVFWIDQEAEWTSTVEIVREWMYTDGVRPLWLQAPIHLDNATSFDTRFLECWDPERPEEWLHEKDPVSLKVNRYGTTRFAKLFDAVLEVELPGRLALVGGIRTEESPARMMAMTSSVAYKGRTWAARLDGGPDRFTFYPIYDWRLADVWKAILDHGWRYNRIYDLQYQRGVPLQQMRVSNLHHETALYALFYLQEADPVLYGKLTRRLPGVDMAGKMGWEDYFAKNLPPMFATWSEYRDFLVEKLVTDRTWHDTLRRTARRWDAFWGEDKKNREAGARVVVQSILANDYTGTKTHNYEGRVISLESKNRWAARLAAAPWRFAKTYAARSPHEYVLRDQDEELHAWMVGQIARFGIDEHFTFGGRPSKWRVYRKDGFRYWVCGSILNRTKETVQPLICERCLKPIGPEAEVVRHANNGYTGEPSQEVFERVWHKECFDL